MINFSCLLKAQEFKTQHKYITSYRPFFYEFTKNHEKKDKEKKQSDDYGSGKANRERQNANGNV